LDDLDWFLAHNVEGYLFHDLRVMQRTSAPEGAPGGALGYPLLMSTFAGIELLGAVLSQEKFDTNAGQRYFQLYWEGFLYPTSHQTARPVVYKLARHGIAHAFLLKGPLGVVKGQPVHHLQYGANGAFYIDATQLATDFMVSYETRVRPFLSTSSAQLNRQTMVQRLEEITKAYGEQAKATLTRPAAAGTPHAPVGASGSVGMSGIVGPISSSVSSSEQLLISDSTKPVYPYGAGLSRCSESPPTPPPLRPSAPRSAPGPPGRS
jgi:hypothetical protein